MTGHSFIGASSAHRWMNCPGSVRLYASLPERRTTEYALTGTAAHEVAERCLKGNLEPVTFVGTEIALLEGNVLVTEDMAEAVGVYVDCVRSDLAKFGGKLLVEQSFSLDWLHEGMFGRNDASIVPALFGTLRIYDYKNGRKPVSAEGNPQGMYYALGALGERNLLFIENVEIVIVQPNAFGKEPVERFRISVEDLYGWAENVLLPAAKRTEDPGAPCIPGDWCTFCEAAHLCPAREEAALSLLDAVPDKGAVASLPPVNTLTPARIGVLSAFFQSEEFTSWVKALAAEEQAMLARGVDVPGRKLIETIVRGNRRWASEEALTQELGKELGDELFNQKIKSPAQLEKVLVQRGIPKKEAEERLAKFITRDESPKAIVVSDNDPRVSASESGDRAIQLFN